MNKVLTLISSHLLFIGCTVSPSLLEAVHETPSVTGYKYCCVPDPTVPASVLLGTCESLQVFGTTYHDGVCYTGKVENPTQYYWRIDAGPEGFRNTIQNQVSSSPLVCPPLN